MLAHDSTQATLRAARCARNPRLRFFYIGDLAPGRTCLSILLLLSSACTTGAAPEEPVLKSLRQQVALHYLEPQPHINLAKYYRDRGNRILSFYILEYARGRFDKDEFKNAFNQIFLGEEPFDNSEQAEAALLKERTAAPQSAQVAEKLADIYVSRNDWPHAKEFLLKCIGLQPNNFGCVSALSEVLTREAKPEESGKLLDQFAERHAGSMEAYTIRIQRIMGEDWSEGGKSDPTRVKAARALLGEAMQKYPKEGTFAFNLSVVAQAEGKLAESQELIEEAASLSTRSAYIQGWTGRFFFRAVKDDDRALKYYLNAYFLDPDFYDTEYAESRIRRLSAEAAQRRFDQLVKERVSPERILQDENPLVVHAAIRLMTDKWDPRFVNPLVEAMSHDDEAVRAAASDVIMEHTDRTFDPQLSSLLADHDLRRRGLAGYIAVKHWGQEGIDAVKPWLNEEAQLARYDAISAVVEFGGAEGRLIAEEHLKREKDPRLKEWLKSALENDHRK